MDDKPIPPEQPRHPLSIAMLFYLVTLSAIVAACARFLRSDDSQPVPMNEPVGLLTGGAVLGFLVGVILCFHRHHHRWMPPLFGLVTGLTASPLLLIPIRNHWQIMVISFVGCWVLIVFSLLVARFRDDPTMTRRHP